ncbi:MAG TPA: HAMP domain-containing sensor histidine kinase [Flavipsychrobacter sp.]|nr:HAMP domain-containing sensor histidine kinase [Flavipsychrobacter sp.]
MTYSRLVTVLVLLFCFQLSAGQTGAGRLKELNKKKEACETLLTNLAGKPESIELLIKEGQEGLKLAHDEDLEQRYVFYLAIGIAYYFKQDFPVAKDNFEKAYEAAVKANQIEKSLRPLGNLVTIYHYLGMQDKADEAAQKLTKAIPTVTDKKVISDSYYNLGIYNQQQKSFYNIALENFLKSAEMNKVLVDTTNSMRVKSDYATKLMMIAESYLYLKQPEKALQYLKEVEPYLGLSMILDVAIYGKFVRAYVMMKDETNALKYYALLHQQAAKTSGKWSELVTSNIHLFVLALERKQFVKAKQYLDAGARQAALDKNPIMVSGVDMHLGEYYKSQGDNVNALKYYEKAEAEGLAMFNKEGYVDMLRSVVPVYLALGNSQKAMAYYDKYLSMSDSITASKIASNIAEQEAVYQNKDKQRQIDVQEAQIAYSKKEKIWLIFGIVMLALAAVALVVNYRNKKRTADILDMNNKRLEHLNNELEEANRTKAKLFGIISHDLRSPIYQVSQFLKIQEVEPDYYTKEQKKNISQKIQAATYSLMETMEDLLLWSKTQMKELHAQAKEMDVSKIIAESLRLNQLQIDTKKLTVNNHLKANTLIKSDPYFLQTIVRNLLQNAVRESLQHGTIHIGGDQHSIFIQNSGGYFSQKEYLAIITARDKDISLSGLGLRTVDELSKKIHAHIEFENTEDQTTRVRIRFS